VNTRGITRGHQFKLEKQYCRTSLRQHFFSNRIIDTWNALDNDTVTVSTLNCFKNRIDLIFQHYMHCEKLSLPVLPFTPVPPLPPEDVDIGNYQKIMIGLDES
jgi:hypothetical protein